MTLIRKLRRLIRKKPFEAEMAEEMRLHLEMLAERHRGAGMSEEDARFAARREFGGVEQIKERARAERGMLWLEEAWKDVRFAARMLRKNVSFTTVAVVSLAIGIGLNTAVFSIINTVFFQTIRGVPQPQRVLFFNGARISLEEFQRLREDMTVARLAASGGMQAAIAIGDVEESRRIGLVSTNYFSVLGVKAARGRLFEASSSAGESALPEAVLNELFWRTRLHRDPAIVGETIRVNGAPLTVIGVAAPDFHGPGPEGPALWVPMGARPLIERATAASAADVAVMGRLNPAVSLDQAQAMVDLVVKRSPDVFAKETRVHLSTGREDWRGEMSAEKRIEFLLVTTVPLVISGGLLWIACSNVGNLLLARAVQRKKEIAIRVARGASRGRLVRMLMAESLLLSLLGGAAGLWVSGATVDFVFATLAEYGAFLVQLDGRVLAYTGVVSVVAALLFGLVPAWQASKADVNQALKGESGSAVFRSSRLRGFFLVTQIASSFALLVVAGTFVKSLVAEAYVGARARSLDHLLLAELSHVQSGRQPEGAYQRLVKERLTAVPGVEAVALIENPDARKVAFTHAAEGTAATRATPEVWLKRIDADFFRVLGATLLRGIVARETAAGEPLGAVVINEAMARVFGGVDAALDRRFRLEQNEHLVTGVVRDGEDEPLVYTVRPTTGAVARSAWIRVQGRADENVAAVREALRSLAPDEAPPPVLPLRHVAFRTLEQLTRLAVFIGGLALALAAAGIHASMAFSTSQRTQEIGIRLALGATREAVLRLVLSGGLKVVAAGCALGFLGALVGLRLLFAMLTGGTGFDAVAIAGVMVFFTATAAGACLQPALKATKVDPLVALRAE